MQKFPTCQSALLIRFKQTRNMRKPKDCLILLVTFTIIGDLLSSRQALYRFLRPLFVVGVYGPLVAFASDTPRMVRFEYQPALTGRDYGKPRSTYPDFEQSPSGLQYKFVDRGTGTRFPTDGDRVVVDWEGYTIGYYGRPFQTRNKVKGGAFDSNEKDYFRWVVGSGNAIGALDEVVRHLHQGDVAQIIVPAELGYPLTGDPQHDIVGPKPRTFSGMRALNFVLDNQNLIDKTLLINVKLVRIDSNYRALIK